MVPEPLRGALSRPGWQDEKVVMMRTTTGDRWEDPVVERKEIGEWRYNDIIGISVELVFQTVDP